ncbi:hypothetical protein VKT23_014013 [Stygiomarasmius scandens]|uniref:JmjC domain-containing protein n=1 Tax=Marasmiellus scandens TaxID=2682957 RepID=A0ABR1J304_9AGAR
MFTQWQLPVRVHSGDGPSLSEESRKKAMSAARTRKYRAKIREKFGGHEALKAMNKRHKQTYRERQRLKAASCVQDGARIGIQTEPESSPSHTTTVTPLSIPHPALIVDEEHDLPDDTLMTAMNEREADLLGGVVGVEFPVDVTTILWKGLGKRTVAPEVKIESENYLKNDFENASYLASADEASSVNCNLTVLHDLSLDQLSKSQKRDIRGHLAQNQCLLIKGQRTRGMVWDVEGTCNHLKISPMMTVEAIDAVKRERSLRASEKTGLIKELDQHVVLTVRDMMENSNNHEQIRALLEIPVPQIESPMGDEYVWAWSALNKFYPMKHQMVYADVHLQRMWALIHYGGFFTDVHIDADGLVTFAHFELGFKFWGLLRCKSVTGKELRDDLVKKTVALWDSGQSEQGNDEWNYQTQADLKMIFGAPGDVLIMPPGQLHMVYTPQRSIAIGGHMLLYDCMHLTELARYIHARHGHTSNDDHSGMHRTLVRMMLALPFVVQDPDRAFYFRPLAAHCYMVMEPSEYDSKVQSSSKRKNAKRRRALKKGLGEVPAKEGSDALKVCGVVLRAIGLSGEDYLRRYMFNLHAEEATSVYSPGDEVDLRGHLPELLACVDTT